MRRLPLLFPTVFLLMFALAACSGEPRSLDGTYQSRLTDGRSVTLEFKTGGEGAWSVADAETVPFKWSVEKNDLVLRTRTGGLVSGELQGDAIRIQLPGVETMTFRPLK